LPIESRTARSGPADPLQTAWNFIGMVTFHILLHELFGQKPPPHLTRERAVEEMVTTFLEGSDRHTASSPVRHTDRHRETSRPDPRTFRTRVRIEQPVPVTTEFVPGRQFS